MRVEREDLRRPDVVEKIEQGSLDRDDEDGDGEVPAVAEELAKKLLRVSITATARFGNSLMNESVVTPFPLV